jgi:hypothetical protein
VSRNSGVGIATGYGLEDRGIRVRVLEKLRNLSSPRRPDGLRGSPNLISSEWPLPGSKATEA